MKRKTTNTRQKKGEAKERESIKSIFSMGQMLHFKLVNKMLNEYCYIHDSKQADKGGDSSIT